ncbi:MAG TPA: nickel pincer cofactor biosynthesis protein LarB [Deltaproteobacteria bacterium]|nr:nickel pincer cofactor biosynthesis protein LarB [Deltaproteobacteria bacterium]
MIQDLLEKYREGEISLEDAEKSLLHLLYEQGEDFLLDLHRNRRLGFPEVVLAEGKTTEQVITIVGNFLKTLNRAFVSSVDQEKEQLLRQRYSHAMITMAGRLMVIKTEEVRSDVEGVVGIITAGTADVPYAEECGLMLQEVGAEVLRAYDFGVSGVHRPFLGIQHTERADILVVFAGMDGILPTMIASLTDKPLIAVPTPIGYGFRGGGETALSVMLQSCVPGILVVNIGNSIGAAAAAVRLLRALHRSRNEDSLPA